MAENNKKLPFFLKEEDLARWTGFWHACRRVLVSGSLNEESLERASLELMKLDYESSEPIMLMIRSGGGGVIPSRQLEDVIAALNSPVDALAIGDCASMAVDLIQACRRRLMLPSSRMLVHYIRNDQRWICDDMDQLAEDIKYFRQRMNDTAERRLALYVRRTGLSAKKIKEMFRHGEVHESWFSATQALKLGLADEILTSFKIFPKSPAKTKK